MKTNKLLIGGTVGGIAFFLLGWLMYGIILKNAMAGCSSPGSMRGEEEMMKYLPLLFLGNVVFGFFLTVIIGWSKASNFVDGMKNGALVGFLVAMSYDLDMYAMSTMMTGMMGIALDVAANVIMCAIVGGIIAIIINAGKKE